MSSGAGDGRMASSGSRRVTPSRCDRRRYGGHQCPYRLGGGSAAEAGTNRGAEASCCIAVGGNSVRRAADTRMCVRSPWQRRPRIQSPSAATDISALRGLARKRDPGCCVSKARRVHDLAARLGGRAHRRLMLDALARMGQTITKWAATGACRWRTERVAHVLDRGIEHGIQTRAASVCP